jgi:serine/threonine protein kinase
MPHDPQDDRAATGLGEGPTTPDPSHGPSGAEAGVEPARAFEPGAIVGGKYVIERVLGEGGMGVVYLAHHQVLSRQVAVKVMKADVAQQPHYTERFVLEARAAAELRHRHVVEILDFGVHEGRPYMVMEFLHGESLEKLLEREGPLSAVRALKVLDPVLRALGVAHEHGIVHRDVKPDNIFLARDEDDADPIVKVVDFGIARRQLAEGAKITGENTTLGTPLYMAPEQILSAHDTTAAADQYAFGVTMYQCLTGRFPFETDTIAGIIANKIAGTPTNILEHRPDLDPDFAAIVMRTLERDPSARFPSMHALRDALAPFAENLAHRGASTVKQLVESAPTAVASPSERPAPSPSPPSSDPPIAVMTGAVRAERTGPIRAAVSPSSRPLVVLGSALAIGAVVIGVLVYRARSNSGETLERQRRQAVSSDADRVEPPRSVLLAVRVTPSTATLELDGEVVGVGAFELLRPADGRRYQLAMSAPGFLTRTEVLVASTDVRIERSLEARIDAAVRLQGTTNPRATSSRVTADSGAPRFVRPVDTRHPTIDRTNPFR